MAWGRRLAVSLGLLGSICAQPASCGEASTSFDVRVHIKPPATSAQATSPGATGGSDTADGSGVCGTTATRSVVSVGCPGNGSGPATPLQVMAFANRETRVSTFDVYAGGARILGWQVMSLDDRDYLELTLGW